MARLRTLMLRAPYYAAHTADFHAASLMKTGWVFNSMARVCSLTEGVMLRRACLVINVSGRVVNVLHPRCYFDLDLNVKLLSFLVESYEIHAYIKAVRVYVLSSAREGFGISFVGASACCAPVVRINHRSGAARELIIASNDRLSELSADALAGRIHKTADASIGAQAGICRLYVWVGERCNFTRWSNPS